jgi:hypothetical protein
MKPEKNRGHGSRNHELQKSKEISMSIRRKEKHSIKQK